MRPDRSASRSISSPMTSQADARRAEIQRERRRRPFSLPDRRIAELNRLLIDRYGEVLPNDDAGRDDAEIVAQHMPLTWHPVDPARRIAGWLRLRAPWMDAAERQAVIEAAVAKPRFWRADTLAKRLNLTEADRQRLNITTIGAADMTREERAALRRQRKRDRDRKRAKARRRADGRKTRAEYLANALSSRRPWVAEGISRRTWERRRAAARAPCRKSVCRKSVAPQ